MDLNVDTLYKQMDIGSCYCVELPFHQHDPHYQYSNGRLGGVLTKSSFSSSPERYRRTAPSACGDAAIGVVLLEALALPFVHGRLVNCP